MKSFDSENCSLSLNPLAVGSTPSAKEEGHLTSPSNDLPTLDRLQVVEQVRRFAGATTDAILDPCMEIFKTSDICGFIAYRMEAKVLIVFGDPTCEGKDKGPLAAAFDQFAKEQGYKVIYVSASKSFAQWASEHLCETKIEFGEELILDPFRAPEKESGTYGSLVRRKIKQSIREGVTFHEFLNDDPHLQQAFMRVGELWLQGRSGPQFHISNIYLFDDVAGKRWFYAKKGDQIVGVITLNQLQTHQGWLLNHLMLTKEAPNGTSELLIVSALETLRNEGCHYVTVGMASLKELGEIVGLGSFSTWVARLGFKIARKIAHLDGLNMFWGKFTPRREPSYLLFSKNHISIREIIAIRRALNGPPKRKKNG
ncbi:MAG: phosphatidylglycerol lysyltransferase domain-containing protein [Parachlamydiales bacterium]